ncbi:MAG: VWA domain-containing protein [Verrucomicrobia bacterium]|nr:VWA domain-containing protein [Verrucomicrobiota bacterium]
MNFQFTHPWWLLLLAGALPAVVGLAWKSDVQIGTWRRWTALALRLAIVLAVIFAIAGLQWLRPLEGMNVMFLLDRSDSVPSPQQEAARKFVNDTAAAKKSTDKAGVIVFGAEASIENTASAATDLEKVQAVVPSVGTDIAAAIRLATAAFPETGQKRIVLLSDGNENIGDAMSALAAAKPLGVSIDVVSLGVARANDVSVQKLSLPGNLKKGQTFEVKIFAQADQAQTATVRLYRNDQPLGEQKVELAAGKNLFTFPQTLTEPGFYAYDVRVEAPGDVTPQNNRASSFTHVRGDPRVLIASADSAVDQPLAAALQSARLSVQIVEAKGFPATLAEMQSFDTIFLSNIAAGDLSLDQLRLLESAVRDFGVGLVCIGGDQTYGAGGYRGTPLETTLPVDMELDSKKVLPSGALVLVMHGMEFANGNQVARDTAVGALDALGPQDEMGVVLWDGTERWLFELTKVGDKKALGRQIQGMNQGDLPTFQGVLAKAQAGLQKSTANLKHIIVFSDGDPSPPSPALMQSIVADKITVSTVLIAGHAGPQTMIAMADQGKGRFYNVQSAEQLPQIFIKEAAVILKSAIFEEPFKPQQAAGSELLRGIAANEYPTLRGYVATSHKPRAETPLVSEKGDPLLAHWQYGLGRAVAFTSDAKAKWATDWLGWEKYRQFWTQIAQWSLRKVDASDFATEVSIENGQGTISVEALDAQGNFRNFLNLQTAVVSPKGERQTVNLMQTGPGHYEARFPAKDVGSYLMNLMDTKDGQLRGAQVLGASVNYSPEFNAIAPNHHLLRRLAESGEGKFLNPALPTDNPFLHDRKKTFQPRDLWEWLLKLAVVLFPIDVGVRRVQLDRAEWLIFWQRILRSLGLGGKTPKQMEADEALGALLARREQVRAKHTVPNVQPDPELFRPKEQPVVETLASSTQATSTPASEHPIKPTQPEKTAPASTASKLLEAKRRAQRRQE